MNCNEAAPAGFPSTALELMRSRFAAFKAGDMKWLLETWHPSTRPPSLDLTENPEWRGLQIVDVVEGQPEDAEGIVEFRATFRRAGRVEALHERALFVREGGRWFYLEGTEPVLIE